jgi:glycerol-3-phosphate dehydrogenase
MIEKDDFGSGASSKSTKLIHGGVRYLQQVFDFSTASLSSRKEKFDLVK